MNKVMKFGFAVLAIVFSLTSCAESTVKSNELTQEVAKTAKMSMSIEGMTCEMGCARAIEVELKNIEGVTSAIVDFKTTTATVEYNTALTSEKALVDFVNNYKGGAYSAKLAKAKCGTEKKSKCCPSKKTSCSDKEKAKCASDKKSCGDKDASKCCSSEEKAKCASDKKACADKSKCKGDKKSCGDKDASKCCSDKEKAKCASEKKACADKDKAKCAGEKKACAEKKSSCSKK